MSGNELISVIIPVYNIEKYLEECLNSVLAQTYRNLEIICIDDGSTDSSGQICDRYASMDGRIRVIHQNNQGAGAARNAGLRKATGEYIGFVDSDDYMAHEMYWELYRVLTSHEGDIAACNTVNVYRNRIDMPQACEQVVSYSGMEFLKRTAEHWKYYIMVNKLFKRSVLKDTVFPEGNVIDDGFFTYQIIARSNKVVWTPQPLYYYRQRKSSVMNLETYQQRREMDTIRLLKEKVEFVKKQYPAVVGPFQRKMLDTYIELICVGHLNNDTQKKCLDYMRHNWSKTLFQDYSVKESIWILLFMLFPEQMKARRNRGIPNAEVSQNNIYFD